MNQTELVNRFSEAALREELQFFAEHEQEWAAQHRGEFVLSASRRLPGFTTAMKTPCAPAFALLDQ
jgi:hypothetical protein